MYLDLYLLIVSIDMGFVYVIVYFATYIHWRYRYMCKVPHVHTVPNTCTANFSFCSLQVR